MFKSGASKKYKLESIYDPKSVTSAETPKVNYENEYGYVSLII
jgi:hypothetical protein